MNKSKWNIGELIDTLNSAVASPPFTDRLQKIHNHSDFHDLIKEFVAPLLPREVFWSTWHIRIKTMSDTDIASYDRTFTAYKNSAQGNKGNFSNVLFTIKDGLSESMTAKQAADHLRKFQINESITQLTEQIAKNEKEIAEYEQYIIDFRKELQSLDAEGA